MKYLFPTVALLFTLSLIVFDNQRLIAQEEIELDHQSPRFQTMARFLTDSQVRDELDLGETQTVELQELFYQFSRSKNRHRRRPLDENGESIQSDTRPPNELVKEFDEGMNSILLPVQLERLDELILQFKIKKLGKSNTLVDPEICNALGIDSKKREQIKRRSEEIQSDLEKQIAKLRADAEQKLFDELTAEQRRKFEAMIGDKFERRERNQIRD